MINCPFLGETEEALVGENDMIHEIDVHQVAGFLQTGCEPDVVRAWEGIPGRMIVQYHYSVSVVQQGSLDDCPVIYGSLRESPHRDHFLCDNTVVGGEKEYPDLLMVQSVENVMDGVRGRLAVENLCSCFSHFQMCFCCLFTGF